MLACEKKLNSGFQIPHTISYTNSRSISAWHVFDSRPLPICSTTDDATTKMDLVQLKPELNTASSHHICLQVKNRHGSCHKARVIDINTLKNGKRDVTTCNMQFTSLLDLVINTPKARILHMEKAQWPKKQCMSRKVRWMISQPIYFLPSCDHFPLP